MKDKLVVLYHTNLTGNPSAGPTYSVPKQIQAQAKIDDVFWINSINTKVKEWEETGLFHTSSEFEFNSLDDLEPPFNKPNVVVFESFYQTRDVKFAKELIRKKIPYIIVPRGALTNEAQRIKWAKKKIGNYLLFNSFAKHAAGIQFLTKKEQLDSGYKWNNKTFVIPNGINMPSFTKSCFSEDKTVFSFIGRIAIRHKGLDLLINAIEMIADELRLKNCIFNIYGPDDSGSVDVLQAMIKERNVTDIVNLFPGVHGKEKEKVLLNTDVFVLTSRFEGHPMGLIEALSYGLPALVTIGSNMRDEIESADAGWTADCTSTSIKKSIESIINHKYQICEKSKNAICLANGYEWNKLSIIAHERFMEISNGK